jgi:hypothetical protein
MTGALMARKTKLSDILAELERIRQDPMSDETSLKLREALRHRSNHVVERAARLVGEFDIDQLEEDLVQAFHRLLIDPLKSDPGCGAKTAIQEALYQIESYQEEVFLVGIRYKQLEPTFGGKEDTAARLRVVSAMALVQLKYPRVMTELAQLLADAELDCRLGAVRAMGLMNSSMSVPLLRFKLLIGDVDARVLHECFQVLMQIDTSESVDFVAGFLDCDEEVLSEAAAFALGESRHAKAFQSLKHWVEGMIDPARRLTGLTAIAMLRNDQALEYLLSVVVDGNRSAAESALTALGIYRDDERVWSRVQEAAETRNDLAPG